MPAQIPPKRHVRNGRTNVSGGRFSRESPCGGVDRIFLIGQPFKAGFWATVFPRVEDRTGGKFGKGKCRDNTCNCFHLLRYRTPGPGWAAAAPEQATFSPPSTIEFTVSAAANVGPLEVFHNAHDWKRPVRLTGMNIDARCPDDDTPTAEIIRVGVPNGSRSLRRWPNLRCSSDTPIYVGVRGNMSA